MVTTPDPMLSGTLWPPAAVALKFPVIFHGGGGWYNSG